MQSAPAVVADRVLLAEAELLRRAGDLQHAVHVMTRLHGAATPNIAHPLARLHLAGGDAAVAEQLLAAFPAERGTVRQRVEGDIVRTLIAAERDHGCALQLLEDALLAAAPIRMRRPFLTEASGLRSLLAERIEAGTNAAAFAVDLLNRMSGQHDQSLPAPPVLIEALTEREHVVLRYLASTLSNAEIAAQLYLSVNTVKTHQRMIYRKLDAAGRRDAVSRAKQLGLL
jgi:LuxR family transcriptional regulator, maltose regulon positive regulatory protein